MQTLTPLTIAGGGLAGLALGIALRRHDVPVVVHEAGSYPRHRVCGEFLSGRGERVLEWLGVADVLDDARPQKTTAWFYRGRQIYSAELPHPAKGISRFALDAALRSRLEELGGVVHERSRLRPEAGEGRVWCGGRIPAKGDWIGLKCHVSGLPLAADLEMHLGANGYVGLARVENDQVNVCGLFRCETSLRGRLPEYLQRGGLSELAARLDGAGPDEASCVAVAGFRPGWQRELPGVLAVGDACGMIPPFAGNGMSMAFEAAWEASGPLVEFAAGREEWGRTCAVVRQRLRGRFSRRLLGARILHPCLTDRAGQALLAAMSRLRLVPFGSAFRLLR
jgi:flavin-dependent dehydrogenase